MIGLGVGIALAIVCLAIVFGVRRARAQRLDREQALAARGSRPCADEADAIAERVRAVRGSSRFTVHQPWKRRADGADIYWYELNVETRHDQAPVASDEFLCRMKRPTDAPFALYLSPQPIGNGLGSKLVQGALAIAAPEGLQKLEVPPALQGGGVLGVFGPRGTRLGDLLDDEKLAALSQGARHGIFAVHGRGDVCTLELAGAYAAKATGRTSWDDTWSFVERLSR